MSDNINKMDFKQLREMVQTLSDELAIMKRKYEDIIYNLDTDNFSSRFVKEQGDMKTAIEVTAKGIKSMVSKEDLKAYSTIEQTAEKISSTVKKEIVTTLIDGGYVTDAILSSHLSQTADEIYLGVSEEYETKDDAETNYTSLESKIAVQKNRISAVISGDYTSDLLSNYFTGIEITPNNIKMIDNDVYSVYNSEGLKFYDSMEQVEGWAIEPDADYGGVLNYYINDGNCYRFGTGESGTGYAYTDMSIKALNGQRGRFVVDVTKSSYPEVKFVGLNDYSDNSNEPRIYANGMLLATQSWVLQNGGGSGSNVAVFA